MLKSVSKTVICVDSDDLALFITDCYKLPRRFGFCCGSNGDMRLFEVVQTKKLTFGSSEFCGWDMVDTLEILDKGETEHWSDIGAILARLVYDEFLPQGNYLVEHYW